MSSSARILYLDTIPGDRIQEMKLGGMRRYAAARGWTVEAVPYAESRPDRIGKVLAGRSPLGCIIECSDGNADLPPRVFGGIPAVYLNGALNLYGGRVARVVTDNSAVARAAFRELSAGRPPAYGVVGFRAVRAWSRVRERSFRAAATEAGFPCRVFARHGGSGGRYDLKRAGRLAKWLAALPRRSAVFAANDATAREVASSARDAGLRIPQDLTLLGVDNHEAICKSCDPPLSSVQMDFERAGFLAARMLGDLLAQRTPRTPRTPREETTPRTPREENVPRAVVEPLMVVRRVSTSGSGRRDARILDAVADIRRRACDGISARDVIAAFPGSRRLFELRFREATGHSVLDEILAVRMEKVFTLLSRTDVPVGAIAAFCGFGSDIALRQLFASRTGMSMRAWRRRARG